MSNQKIVHKAIELRNESDEFDGTDSPDDVVEHLLEERLTELREGRQKAEEKREELRDSLGIGPDESAENTSGSSETEAEAKRKELREKYGK